MCGIVGLIMTKNYGEYLGRRKAFEQMLLADQVRGIDGTGIALLESKKPAKVYKRAYPAADFLQLNLAKSLISDVSSASAVIGHNRASTRGGNSDDNSHPFRCGPITLVHNGSLTSWYNLNNRQFEVDSHAICNALSEQSVDEVINKINGAFALVWHDQRDNSINFIRNSERPMYFIELTSNVHGQGGWAFGSEHVMLQWILGRNQLPRKAPLDTAIHTLYKFDLEDPLTFSERKIEVGKYESWTSPHRSGNSLALSQNGNTRGGRNTTTGRRPSLWEDRLQELKLRVGDKVEFMPTEFVQYPNNSTGLGMVRGELLLDERDANCVLHSVHKRWYDSLADRSFACIEATISSYSIADEVVNLYNPSIVLSKEEDTSKKPLPLPSYRDLTHSEYDDDAEEEQMIRGPGGLYIPRKKWDTLTSRGCENCSEVLDPVQQDFIVWTANQKPICPSCVDEVGQLVSLL